MKIIKAICLLFVSATCWGKEPTFKETVDFISSQFNSARVKLIDPNMPDHFRHLFTIQGEWHKVDSYQTGKDGNKVTPECFMGSRFVDLYSGDPKDETYSIDINIRNLSVAYTQEDQGLDDESRIIDIRGAMYYVFQIRGNENSRRFESINRAQFLLDSPARAQRIRNAFRHLIKLCPPKDDLPF